MRNVILRGASHARNSPYVLRPHVEPLRLLHTAPDGNQVFDEGDSVILKDCERVDAPPILVNPLKIGATHHGHKGSLEHSEIVGKQSRDVVYTNRTYKYRVHVPSLSDYVLLSPRKVTPNYPGDANLIVSLLDLHPTSTELPLEILEAGTGHGALTIYLSRAIHAANAPLYERLALRQEQTTSDGSDAQLDTNSTSGIVANDAWKSERRAIIHTVDISKEHSLHARKTVHGFRNSLYSNNIDFHVADVSSFIAEQFTTRNSRAPFLHHAILDLPNADMHLSAVTDALRVDGSLVVFSPSITQITQCATVVKGMKLRLWLEQTVELGAGFTAGRQWDVRHVQPRAVRKALELRVAEEAETATVAPAGFAEGADSADSTTAARAINDSSTQQAAKWEMVCRPKVGERIIGGGFVALWKKTSNLN